MKNKRQRIISLLFSYILYIISGSLIIIYSNWQTFVGVMVFMVAFRFTEEETNRFKEDKE